MERAGRPSRWRPHGALIGLPAVSAALRVAVVLGGGQGYWSAEYRYGRSWQLVADVLGAPTPRKALGQIVALMVGTYDHMGFVLAGAPAALVQRATLGLLGWPLDAASVGWG